MAVLENYREASRAGIEQGGNSGRVLKMTGWVWEGEVVWGLQAMV